MNLGSNLQNVIKNFPPGYFALVMATGIISIACRQLQFDWLARSLFMLNNVQYFILLLIFIIRLAFFFPQVKKDLSTHAKGAGFLTFVAASCILGTGYVQAKQLFFIGGFLLAVSLVAWLIILYSFLTSVILQKKKPTLEIGMNGSWLLLIVSIQSLVILATWMGSHLPIPMQASLFVSLAGWLVGFLLYVMLVTIIIYRLTFYPVNASEVSPSYWIDTGAAAISTLAGVTLSNALTPVAGFQQFVPIVNLLSLLLWAAATFWLPLLFILETWRHLKVGFKYSPDYWGMVFPLGMYTIATLKLASLLQMPFLNSIPHVFIFIALAAWLVTFIGMISAGIKVLSTEKKIKISAS